MSDALDPQALERSARALLDSRIEAVRELAKSQAEMDHALELVATMEPKHAQVYAAATRAGWTEAELKQLGLRLPQRRAAGRPRRARSETPPRAATKTAALASND